MASSILFVTGTDTGVGKTVVAGLLTRHLLDSGVRVAPLKPVCSGGRDDARLLRAASDGALSLDEINPWHYRAPLAPVLAARKDRQTLRLARVLAHVRAVKRQSAVVIVEGAGGLFSPLGEGFDSRDVLVALRATPLVVCPNRLGAINQVRLVLTALPQGLRRRANVVLTAPERRQAEIASNPRLLAEFFDAKRLHLLPRVHEPGQAERALAERGVRRTIVRLAQALLDPQTIGQATPAAKSALVPP